MVVALIQSILSLPLTLVSTAIGLAQSIISLPVMLISAAAGVASTVISTLLSIPVYIFNLFLNGALFLYNEIMEYRYIILFVLPAAIAAGLTFRYVTGI